MEKVNIDIVSEKFPQLSAEIADRGEAVKEDPVTLFVK